METVSPASQKTAAANRKSSSLPATVKRHLDLYLMVIPGLVFLAVFKYTPMYGVIIAFQDFNVFGGIRGSEWVGMANFYKLFHSADFYTVFRNTLLISIYRTLFYFPIPIFTALVLNEIRRILFKRTIQTIIYLPHFLSWVIVAGLFVNILAPSGGIVNRLIQMLGGEPISFLMDKQVFRGVLVGTSIWKEAGWGAIIYIAAIAGVSHELYEAAIVDGAGRIRQMIHITLPGIASTIVLMFILRLGSLMDAGTEQILMMYNPVVYEVGDVIGTFVYRVGLGKMDYSFSTAVGLFNSVVGFILIVSGNYLSRKITEKSIW